MLALTEGNNFREIIIKGKIVNILRPKIDIEQKTENVRIIVAANDGLTEKSASKIEIMEMSKTCQPCHVGQFFIPSERKETDTESQFIFLKIK